MANLPEKILNSRVVLRRDHYYALNIVMFAMVMFSLGFHLLGDLVDIAAVALFIRRFLVKGN